MKKKTTPEPYEPPEIISLDLPRAFGVCGDGSDPGVGSCSTGGYAQGTCVAGDWSPPGCYPGTGGPS